MHSKVATFSLLLSKGYQAVRRNKVSSVVLVYRSMGTEFAVHSNWGINHKKISLYDRMNSESELERDRIDPSLYTAAHNDDA